MTSTGAQPALVVDRVTKWYGNVLAVDDVTLEIGEGEFFSLLGPSGCGKTTTLRMMAGFEDPDAGRILLRGTDVTATPPNRRNVNMVFQQYELFPHMTVFENVAYGLRLKRTPRKELTERVQQMLAAVQVEDLAARGARQLSGGQQQRVALARALVNRPAVLLLDEPLSALDVKLRKQMQLELKSIQHALGTTFVYVTHDQEEALLLSDRIGIMDAGRLLQVASPREIYERPATGFVADFVGSLNVFRGVVADREGDLAYVRPSPVERLVVVAADGVAPGGAIRLAVRPERVAIDRGSTAERSSDPPDPHWSRVEGRVTERIYLGRTTVLGVITGSSGRVTVERVSDGSFDSFEPGTPVVLSWPPEAAFVLPEGEA